MTYTENYSKYIQEKATRLVAKQRVIELFRIREYSTIIVVGDTKTYHVHLWNDGTMECSCPYWTYKRQICSHIIASQLCPNPLKSEDQQRTSPNLPWKSLSVLSPEFHTSLIRKRGGRAKMICVYCGADMTSKDPDVFYNERWVCPICGFRYLEEWFR
ncbi:MAG: SWIM zinc finger family protein [Candidatus Heimdallarchaeota archaeon]